MFSCRGIAILVVGIVAASCSSPAYQAYAEAMNQATDTAARTKAMSQFCLERGIELQDNAKGSRAIHNTLLYTGSSIAGLGLVSLAVEGALRENHPAEEQWRIASLSLASAGSAILALITLTNLGGKAETESTQASYNEAAAPLIAAESDMEKAKALFMPCVAPIQMFQSR